MSATATWSFVDLTTGEFTGGAATGGMEVGTAQPENILPVLGVWPAHEWRYDTALQVVVRKPAGLPDAGDLASQSQAARELLAAMSAAEKPSLRAIRDCILALHRGEPMPEGAIARLQAIEDEAAELRPAGQQARATLAARSA